jgi:hypothetical protein
MPAPLAKLAWAENWAALEAGLNAGRDPNAAAERYGHGSGEKRPPLYLAASRGAPRAIVALLLSKGAHANWTDASGATALHEAVRRDRFAGYTDNHTEIVRALGEHRGCPLDAQTNGGRGYTPLHWAARNGHTQAARALLELGADASLRNEADQTGHAAATPLRLAEAYGKDEIVQLLRGDPELLARGTPGHARHCGLADAALPTGTRLQVEPHGEGTYERFEKRTFGANTHFVRFDGAEDATAEQPVQLKILGPAAWSVLPPPTVELEIVEVTGKISVLGGVSLGWTAGRLGQAIGEQRGVAPETLRLIVGEQALDGKEGLLLPAVGIGAESTAGNKRVHVMPQTAEQAAARRAAVVVAASGVVEESQPLEPAAAAAAAAAVRQRRRGGGWCCSAPPAAQ